MSGLPAGVAGGGEVQMEGRDQDGSHPSEWPRHRQEVKCDDCLIVEGWKRREAVGWLLISSWWMVGMSHRLIDIGAWRAGGGYAGDTDFGLWVEMKEPHLTFLSLLRNVYFTPQLGLLSTLPATALCLVHEAMPKVSASFGVVVFLSLSLFLPPSLPSFSFIRCNWQVGIVHI